jgi:hypothetical protein
MWSFKVYIILQAQWTLLIVITLGHSLIDNNNRRNTNAAVQGCLLMQSGNVYMKRWKWAVRKL